MLEGSPNIDFFLSKAEREHSNPDRERGPKPPPPPERERESKREQDKERERKRARKRRRGEGKSIALYIKKPTSRSPAPEAAPMLVVVVRTKRVKEQGSEALLTYAELSLARAPDFRIRATCRNTELV